MNLLTIKDFPALFFHQDNKIINRHGCQFLALSGTRAYGHINYFLIADYQHIRDLVKLGLPDFFAQLFISEVGFCPDACGLELFGN